MNWIEHPTVFEGKNVRLIPLESAHFEELSVLAAEAAIWNYPVMDIMNGSDTEKLFQSLGREIAKRDSGEFYPFVILLKSTRKLVGHTIYWGMNREHRSLEIGSTWIHPQYWGTQVNTECKYLMLKHCFETLKTIRVQIKAVETNIRSRSAIQKVGFTFEGILRKDKILEDGSIRTAAYYSIIDDEWPTVKLNLERMLGL